LLTPGRSDGLDLTLVARIFSDMPLTRLAAYLRALRHHGWRAWATGRDGILNLHAAKVGQEGVFFRFLVADGKVHELSSPRVAYHSAEALEARLLDHATHTASFVLILAGDGDPFPAWQRLATGGMISPFDGPFSEIELPNPPDALVDAFVAALTNLEQLDPRVVELAAVLDAFAVDATGTAGVRLGVYRGGGSFSLSLGRPRGRSWSWLSIDLERTGMRTGLRTGPVRLADTSGLQAWLEAHLCSAEGRWIAADVRSSKADRPDGWWDADAPLLPGVPRAGRSDWSDRVEALLAPVPSTEVGLAKLDALRLQAAASGGRAWTATIEGVDPWWWLRLEFPEGRAQVRLLVSGDELIPPILWPEDPAEWVARLIRKARGWASPPDVAAILAETTLTWVDRGIAAWWCADHEKLELRVRPADSGELVAWVARLPFPVQSDGLRERIAAELDGADARLVLRQMPMARGPRVWADHQAGLWLARDAYQELVSRTLAGGVQPCTLTLNHHSAEHALDMVGKQQLVNIAGVEVRVEATEICGPEQVLVRGMARFAAEDGRLPL
jgi:hypothetical protein